MLIERQDSMISQLEYEKVRLVFHLIGLPRFLSQPKYPILINFIRTLHCMYDVHFRPLIAYLSFLHI